MQSIPIKNGILHLSENKAVCPYCERKISIDEIEDKFMKQNKHYIRMKCKCSRFIGITSNIIGDYVAYDLQEKLLN